MLFIQLFIGLILGVIGIFYFSQIFFSLFYFLPKSIFLVVNGKLRGASIIKSLVAPTIWLALPFLIGFFFPSFVDSNFIRFLNNPVSTIVCNVIILMLVLRTVFTKKGRTDAKEDFWNTMNRYRLHENVDLNGVELAYFGDGLNYYKSNDYISSISSFNITIDTLTSSGEIDYNKELLKDAYYNRGCAKDELNQYDEAIIDYTKSIELGTNNSSEYLNRGITKAKLKYFTEAIEDYNKSISIDSKSSAAHYNRGISRYANGDKEGACLDWSKAEHLGEAQASVMLKNYCY